MPQSRFPYGNAFIIQTPKSDRLVQQIAQDQRQKDLFEQQQARLLDQEFSKNVTDIRDTDVGDAVKAYQQYKAIGQDIYKNGNRMSNDQRIAAQLQKQRAAQQYYSLVNKSKELKAPEDEFQKGYIKDPYKYDENTPDVLMQSRNTPVLQHPGLGALSNGVQLKTQDFTKNVAAAVGKQTKVGNDVQNNGLTSTPTDYYAFNSPSQFATTLSGSIPDKRAQNKFVTQHSYNDLAAQDLLQRYSVLSQTPEFKKAYPNEPPINTEALNDPFQKAVTLTSIDHILRHPPTAIVGKSYNNTRAVMDRNDATWLAHNAITNEEKIKAAALRSARSDARLNKMMSGTEGVGYPLDEVVNDLVTKHEIKGEGGASYGTQDRVYKKDIPVGEMELYSPKDARVHGYKDLETGEEYFIPRTDKKGHKELEGEGGKKIGAEVARQNLIKVIPNNKNKQGLYFNKGQVKQRDKAYKFDN